MSDSNVDKSRQALATALQALRLPTAGCRPAEELLPGLALRRGALIEWLGQEGGGATTLALIAARQACGPRQAIVVVDRQRRFYPPAAAGLGIDLESLIVVSPRNQRDYLWALTQALGCPGVAAVLCWPEKLDDKAFRRLQLAAERGGGLGFLVRPVEVRGSPTWSELQLLVQPVPVEEGRRFQVSVLRDRGGNAGKLIEWELNDESNTLHLTSLDPQPSSFNPQPLALHLASELAAPATAQRAARARPSAGRTV
jgi:protein ImuA